MSGPRGVLRYRIMGGGALRRRRRIPRRSDLGAAVVVGVTFACIAVVGGFVFLETQMEPAGGSFGIRTHIPLCGRQFETSPDTARRYTMVEIEATIAPGYRPIVLEPTIGDLPVLGLFESHPFPPGMAACDTLIFLHVGPDSYLSYGLMGSG